MIDLCIRAGQLIDGTGRSADVADVAIDRGRIMDVGPHLEVNARREVDASDLLVTPGFIDIHTHYDGQATWDTQLAPSCWHGVTTVVMGNCGVGFAPAKGDMHDSLISILEGVEDIPGSALSEGLTWQWESFPAYLEELTRLRRTIDVAAMIPHVPLRAFVMGERGAIVDEDPLPNEIAEMANLVREALIAGAAGFSTSRHDTHRTSEGELLGTLHAGRDELLAICESMATTRTGVIQLISDAYKADSDTIRNAELALLREMARVSRRPISCSILQDNERPEGWRALQEEIHNLCRDGYRAKGQVSTRPIGVILGLEASVTPFSNCPSFAEISGLPLSEKVRALQDPARRQSILMEYETNKHRHFTDVDMVFELSDNVDMQLRIEESFGERSRRSARSSKELVFDALLQNNGRQLLYRPTTNFAHRSMETVREMMTDEHAIFGLSDAGAHCGFLCDSSSTTTSLVGWPQHSSDAGVLSREWLVHGFTQRIARHMGWEDRGVVAPGFLADINLIDAESLRCHHPKIVYDLPLGGRRLVQEASGYVMTVKSGAVTFENGQATGECPGLLVRSAPDKEFT